jgi:MoxR-like ATPase
MENDEIRLIGALQMNMAEVVLGKVDVIRMCLVALLAGEHVLLEDVPGVGKTLVAKALAKSVHGSFCRIQFTPDLLPSDIVGSSIYDTHSGKFHFNQGPIFANVVLADEINRTPPRTQSALLEAMSDGQVSVDGVSHPLPAPFIVMATQNPFEFEGTYPLPESQLDRFLIRLSMGYPSREDERRVLMSHRDQEPVERLQPVIESQQILDLQRAVRQVTVEDSIYEYLLDIVEATRQSDELRVGVSTRGALCFYRAAQALALIRGRTYVVPDDIKELAVPVLSHRVVPKG